MGIEKIFYSVKEVSEKVDVSVSKIYSDIQWGRIIIVRICGTIRISKRALELYKEVYIDGRKIS